MATIPLYYTESFLGAYQGQNTAVADEQTFTASQDNLELYLDTLRGAASQTIPSPASSNPQGGPFHGMYNRIYPIRATTAINITGIVAPTISGAQQFPLVLKNTGSNTITLKNNTTSTNANRLICTGGSDLTITAGNYRVLVYDTIASRWSVGISMYSGAFKVAVPATDGAWTIFDAAFWDAVNPGFFDNAGTATATTATLWGAYGFTAPTPLTYTTSATGNSSLPLVAGQARIIQCKRELPIMTWISGSGNICALFSKNEQGNGFNKQGW